MKSYKVSPFVFSITRSIVTLRPFNLSIFSLFIFKLFQIYIFSVLNMNNMTPKTRRGCFQNCSTPSKEKLSCLGEHYYHKILVPWVVAWVVVAWGLQVSHLLPRPTEKNELLGPHKRYWSEILRISSNSPNLIFGLILVNPIGSSN